VFEITSDVHFDRMVVFSLCDSTGTVISLNLSVELRHPRSQLIPTRVDKPRLINDLDHGQTETTTNIVIEVSLKSPVQV
jgi:hypothetical protein